MILLQIQETIISHSHSVWDNIFFYLFAISIIGTIVMSLILTRILKNRVIEMELCQKEHVARIDKIRKECSDSLEILRIEMLKREEERSRQWMESEKETLYVLNSVSDLLDLTDKIGRVDSEKIIDKLNEIQLKIVNLQSNQ